MNNAEQSGQYVNEQGLNMEESHPEKGVLFSRRRNITFLLVFYVVLLKTFATYFVKGKDPLKKVEFSIGK